MGRYACKLVWALVVVAAARAQVFTVGEKTATADIKTDFTPTRVELPQREMTQLGARQLVRDLDAEQGFAHRVLPLGTIVTLQANGRMSPSSEEYKKMIYKKGQSAAVGDRVVVTALQVKGDAILVDLNGGPYVKHRFTRHIQIGVGGAQVTPQQNLDEQATGFRVALVFEGGVPEVSGAEVKALLAPIVDFGAKTGELAYSETLPPPIKSAIDSHEVLVGMDRRMVLASLGAPDQKVRETGSEGRYEEWIYGHQPQPIKFIRFVGDKVTLVKVAAVGRAIAVDDKNRVGDLPPAAGPAINVAQGPDTTDKKAAPPSLRLPGEAPVATTGDANGKVQFPEEHKPIQPPNHVPDELMTAPGSLQR